MARDSYIRFSTVTGKSYDVFRCVKVRNFLQVQAYMSNDVYPVDIRVEYNNRENKNGLVFYFDKEGSAEVFDKWCNRELEF